jgi:hypothetical protein
LDTDRFGTEGEQTLIPAEMVEMHIPLRDKLGTQKDVRFEILLHLPYVDDLEGDKKTFEVAQGIPSVEKPYGEDGPKVQLLDPMSIMLAKSGVIEGWHHYKKYEKYCWHLRVLSYCVPLYLAEKTQAFNEGRLDRNPAIMARRLLADTNDWRKDREYYEAFGGNREALDDFKRSLIPYARTVSKTLYEPSDVCAVAA